MNKKNYIWLVLLVVGTVLVILRHNNIISWGESSVTYRNEKGLIFGTLYSITYENNESLKLEIDETLDRFDASLSMFNENSIISRINRNEDVTVDSLFAKVFKLSMQTSEATDGCFDITVAPLVNAWGFGFTDEVSPSDVKIDSLLQVVGWEKVQLTPEGKIVKQDPRVMLDCSAIAKGYAVDVIADLLKSKGIKNYLVDIGGEVVVAGVNPSGNLWRVGVNKPEEDALSRNMNLETILSISNRGIATSGNYRNFYYKDGMKFAHTIDPKSGRPIQHNILSATVIANNCITADAFSTAFMVMGLERAKEVLAKHKDLEAYFILADKGDDYQTFMTEGMKEYVIE
ncbi:MAG: FAD:protein FMN transferase [Bacteroidaceae bacterium]|nr:FAD:protein FMN transferase [Bacteroidaceae bacterium]